MVAGGQPLPAARQPLQPSNLDMDMLIYSCNFEACLRTPERSADLCSLSDAETEPEVYQ